MEIVTNALRMVSLRGVELEKNQTRVITVLFTRYYSTFANFIYLISGKGYTHASIALDEENDYYYSFNYKGFRKEYPKKHSRMDKRSICIKLEVSQESFDKMQKMIAEMEERGEKLHYSRLGVLLCLFRIPCKIQNQYFCSQFVAEILQLSDAVRLSKGVSLYLPNQLSLELCRQNCLREIVYNPI